MTRGIRFSRKVYELALEANRERRVAVVASFGHAYYERHASRDAAREFTRLLKLRHNIIARYQREWGGDPKHGI